MTRRPGGVSTGEGSEGPAGWQLVDCARREVPAGATILSDRDGAVLAGAVVNAGSYSDA